MLTAHINREISMSQIDDDIGASLSPYFAHSCVISFNITTQEIFVSLSLSLLGSHTFYSSIQIKRAANPQKNWYIITYRYSNIIFMRISVSFITLYAAVRFLFWILSKYICANAKTAVKYSPMRDMNINYNNFFFFLKCIMIDSYIEKKISWCSIHIWWTAVRRN